MKTYKILLGVIAVASGLAITNGVSADCFYEEVEPTCLIDGQTKNNTCQGWSDTSSRSLPSVYDGECYGADITLSDAQKKRIDTAIVPLFEAYSDGDMYMQSDYFTLTNEGRDFVNQTYFPIVSDLILREREQPNPNTKKLTILYYLGSIVGYDYSIRKLP